MYIYAFLLRVTDAMTSQNIDLSSWDTLCVCSVCVAQADWTLILPSATSCESDWSLAEKNVAVRHTLFTSFVNY
jgi:hypothetical protein